MFPVLQISARLQLPGLLIVFLAVFYNQHCYVRYQKYVDKALALSRNILAFVRELATAQGSHEADVQNAARYVNAAHHLAYYQIGHVMHYSTLVKRKLLTEEEVSHVKEFDSDEYTLLMAWAFDIIHQRMVKHHLHPMAFKGMRDQLDKIQNDLVLSMIFLFCTHRSSFMHRVNYLKLRMFLFRLPIITCSMRPVSSI